MASRAPFGNDLQPNFEVRVVGGRLLHVPVKDQQLSRKWAGGRGGQHQETTCTGTTKSSSKNTGVLSIAGAVRVHRRLRKSQGNINLDMSKRMSHSRSKRQQSLLPALEEDTNELEEECLYGQDNFNPSVRRHKLPVISDPLSNVDQRLTRDCLQTSQFEMKFKEIKTLLEVMFKPIVNRLGSVGDIRQSCRRMDEAQMGVLNKELLLRVFRSYGVRVDSLNFMQLVRLTSCSVGTEHVLYQKLCEIIHRFFCDDKAAIVAIITTRALNADTPCGSVESCSPVSVEDYSLGHSVHTLPPLVDSLTNSNLTLGALARLHENRKMISTSRPLRSIKTHPLSKSQSKSGILRLPLLSDVGVKPSDPAVNRVSKSCGEWPLLLGEQETHNVVDGIERMHNALKSCTTNDGK